MIGSKLALLSFTPTSMKVRPRSKGIALVTSLFLLLIMTIIGVTSINVTNLEEKMAANTRDRQVAFHAAEAALLDAERYLETIVSTNDFTEAGATGLYRISDHSQTPAWQTVDWTQTDGEGSVDYSSTFPGVHVQPRYIIEYYTQVATQANDINIGNYGQNTGSGTVDVFRITAYGQGSSSGSKVLLQTTYGKLM